MNDISKAEGLPNPANSDNAQRCVPLCGCTTAVPGELPNAIADPCAKCWLGKVCIQAGMVPEDLELVRIAMVRRHLARGAALYRTGDHFHSLFVVQSGALKSLAVSSGGQEKITAFHLPGEMLGLPGIGAGHYTRDAIAVDETHVCVIPYAPLLEVTLQQPQVQRRLFMVLSCAIVRHQRLLELLEQMTAEQRVVACLLTIAARYEKAGYRAQAFPLPITRIDMGNYLGLAHETVTRVLSHLHKEGYIHLEEKYVALKDIARLAKIPYPYEPPVCDCDFFGC